METWSIGKAVYTHTLLKPIIGNNDAHKSSSINSDTQALGTSSVRRSHTQTHTHTRDDKHTVLVFHHGQLASLARRPKVSFSEISSDNFMSPWRLFKLESLTAHSAETTPQHREWWQTGRLIPTFKGHPCVIDVRVRACVNNESVT